MTACAFTYSISAGATALAGIATITSSTRTIALQTDLPAKAAVYSLTILAKSPADVGFTIPGTTTGTNSLTWALTIAVDECEPPASVTPTATTGTTAYTIAAAASTITWDAFAHTTASGGNDCVLTYAATIPSTVATLPAAFTTTDVAANRNLVLQTTVNGNVGSHAIVITAVTPFGNALSTAGQFLTQTVTIAADPCEPPATTVASTLTA